MSSEFERILENPDHVIMSDDLRSSITSLETADQELLIDGYAFVCTLKSAVLLSRQDKRWKFVLEVPGLVFKDIAALPSIVLTYDGIKFSGLEGLEFESENLDAQRVTLILKEIIKTEEGDYE